MPKSPAAAATTTKSNKASSSVTSGSRETRAKNGSKVERDSAIVSAVAIQSSTIEWTQPSQDEIAFRAYFIGKERIADNLPGDAVTDWLQAEMELSAERSFDELAVSRN